VRELPDRRSLQMAGQDGAAVTRAGPRAVSDLILPALGSAIGAISRL
jgi:hypothetical protein